MNALVSKYFIERTDDTFIQFFRYVFVGGTATVFDMGSYYIALNIFHFHYIFAQTIAFIVGLTVNYLLSIVWVFRSSGNVKKEFTVFAIIGIGGLLLSYALLWLFVDILHLNYFQGMLAKALTVALVLVWNFAMRKKFVF